MSAFSTFDYVEDGSGTVFVVRTPLDGVSNYVLYPAYRRVGQGLQRVVHTGEHLDGEPGSDWAVDAGCVVRPAEFLRLVRRWDERPVGRRRSATLIWLGFLHRSMSLAVACSCTGRGCWTWPRHGRIGTCS